MNSFLAMVQRRRTALIVTLVIALLALPFVLRAITPTYLGVAHVMMVGKDSMIPSSDMGTLTMSAAVMDRVAKRFNLGGADALRPRVDAKPGLHSNVMPIIYRDKNPKLARDVTNAIADETVVYYKELSGGQYDLMLSYLQSAIKRDTDQMQAIDAQLQRAAQRDTFAGSDRALESITGEINTLQAQRGAAYATLVSDEAIASAQSAQPAEIAGIVRHEVLSSDPFVQALRLNQARDAAQLEQQRSEYTNTYPGLPGLNEQVQRESSAVNAAERAAMAVPPSSSNSYAATVLARRSAMAVAAGDRARLAAIDDQIESAKEHLQDLPITGAAVNLLRTQRDAAQAAYTATIARLNDTRAAQAAASSLGAVVVIDHSAAASPRIPRAALDFIVIFLMLALTISVGFAIDILDSSLRSPEAIEKLYGVPVIGNLGSR